MDRGRSCMASKDGTSDVEVEDAKESAKQLVYSGSSGSLISISIDSMEVPPGKAHPSQGTHDVVPIQQNHT